MTENDQPAQSVFVEALKLLPQDPSGSVRMIFAAQPDRPASRPPISHSP